MGDGEWKTAPLFQTIPPFAGPNDPRIEIGGNIPADLVTRYATIPETITGGIFLYQGTTGAYAYLILTQTAGGTARLCIGSRTSGATIAEYFNMQAGASHGVTWGRLSTALATLVETEILNNNIELIGTGTFNPRIIVSNDASITVQDEGEINFVDVGTGPRFLRMGNNSEIEVESGATLTVESGGLLTADAGSDANFNGDITASSLRHVTNTQNTSSTRAVNTYANLTNIAGTDFVAPASGIVTIYYSAHMQNNNVAGASVLAPEVAEGSTVGSGTVVVAAADTNALIFTQHATASEGLRYGGQVTVTGLTPGDDYNVSLQGRTNGTGTSTFTSLHTTVVPSP